MRREGSTLLRQAPVTRATPPLIPSTTADFCLPHRRTGAPGNSKPSWRKQSCQRREPSVATCSPPSNLFQTKRFFSGLGNTAILLKINRNCIANHANRVCWVFKSLTKLDVWLFSVLDLNCALELVFWGLGAWIGKKRFCARSQ